MTKEQRKIYQQQYHEKHKELLNNHARVYYAEHREELLAYSKRYQADHPEKLKHRRVDHQKKLNAIKVAMGCIDCGYNANPVALDFDHVAGKKKFGLSQGVSRGGIKSLLSEAAKCVVRCANCHRIKTFGTIKSL